MQKSELIPTLESKKPKAYYYATLLDHFFVFFLNDPIDKDSR